MFTKILAAVFISTFGVSVFASADFDNISDFKKLRINECEEYLKTSDEVSDCDELSADFVDFRNEKLVSMDQHELTINDSADGKSLTPAAERHQKRQEQLKTITYPSIEWAADAFEGRNSEESSLTSYENSEESSLTSHENSEICSVSSENNNDDELNDEKSDFSSVVSSFSSGKRSLAYHTDLSSLPYLMRRESIDDPDTKSITVDVQSVKSSPIDMHSFNECDFGCPSFLWSSTNSPISPRHKKVYSNDGKILRTFSGTLI